MNITVEADTTGFAPRDCRYSAVDDDTYDGAPDSRARAAVGYGAARGRTQHRHRLAA